MVCTDWTNMMKKIKHKARSSTHGLSDLLAVSHRHCGKHWRARYLDPLHVIYCIFMTTSKTVAHAITYRLVFISSLSRVQIVPYTYSGIVSSSHCHLYLQLVLVNTIDGYKLGLEDCVLSTHHLWYLGRDIHTQHAVRGDRAGATAAIRPVRLDGKLALLARAHVQQSLVPALDDLALANGEAEWLAAVVRSVELAAVALEGAAVVHLDAVAGLGRALALDLVGDFGLEVLRKR